MFHSLKSLYATENEEYAGGGNIVRATGSPHVGQER